MAPAPVKFTVLVPQAKVPVLVLVQLAAAVRVVFARVRLPALVMAPVIVLLLAMDRLPAFARGPATVSGLGPVEVTVAPAAFARAVA